MVRGLGSKISWHNQRVISSGIVPGEVTEWLVDNGSLTRRLVQLCAGDFQVKLLSECRERPRLDEVKVLKMRGAEHARIRQVLLCAGDTPLVYARTVIPLSTIQGAARRLAHMGNRPLGALLFANKGMRRGPLQISRQRIDMLDVISPKEMVWGRRSLFFLEGRPLLVSEFFLPSLFEMVSDKGAK